MDMNVNMILGPIVLAVVVNVSFFSPRPHFALGVSWMLIGLMFVQAVLYGTCVVQWYTYWTSGFKDPWSTK